MKVKLLSKHYQVNLHRVVRYANKDDASIFLIYNCQFNLIQFNLK